MKMVDIENKFRLHKLSHKTKIMTTAFSSTAGAICLVIFLILICVARRRTHIAKRPNNMLKSRVTTSSILLENELGSNSPVKETAEEAQIQKSTFKFWLY